MKKIITASWCVTVALLCLAAAKGSPSQLQTGDLVFQTSKTSLSAVTASTTGSSLTHVGMILRKNNKFYVIEAVGPVRIITLDKFIGKGMAGRYVIRRLKKKLSPQAKRSVALAARKFLGRRYDHKFSWSDNKIYCSELIYKAYMRTTGIKIGKIQKKKDLYSNWNPLLRIYINKVYKGKPPMEEKIITPKSMYDSDLLETVYSNYPI